jgi:hypothetical protein
MIKVISDTFNIPLIYDNIILNNNDNNNNENIDNGNENNDNMNNNNNNNYNVNGNNNNGNNNNDNDNNNNNNNNENNNNGEGNNNVNNDDGNDNDNNVNNENNNNGNDNNINNENNNNGNDNNLGNNINNNALNLNNNLMNNNYIRALLIAPCTNNDENRSYNSATVIDRIFLPRKHGGIGLSRKYGITSENGMIIMTLRYQKWLQTIYPDDDMHINYPLNATVVIPGKAEKAIIDTELTVAHLDALIDTTAPGVLKAAKNKLYSSKAEKIAVMLSANPLNRCHAAWFRSMGTGSSSQNSWMDQCNGTCNENFISQGQFKDAFRNGLGVGIYNEKKTAPILCKWGCGKLINVEEDPGHAFGCNKVTKQVVWRHNTLRDGYIEMIKSIDPLADIESEQIVGHRMSADGWVAVRCDALYNIGPESYIIDFVVVNPSSKTYNRNGMHAYSTVNCAALIAQKSKRDHYATAVPPIDPRRIIPFAIEATGRLGPEAKAFLFKTCGTETFRRSIFLKKVSMTCARFVGKILNSSRVQQALLPQNGAA